MERVCSHCGALLIEEFKFCAKCGRAIGSSWQETRFDSNVDYGGILNRDYYDRNPADEHTIKENYFSYRVRLNRKLYLFRKLAEFLALVVLVILSIILILLILVIPAAIAVPASGIMLTIRRVTILIRDVGSIFFYSFLLQLLSLRFTCYWPRERTGPITMALIPCAPYHCLDIKIKNMIVKEL